MDLESEWQGVRDDRPGLSGAGIGMVRVTLLFGTAAVALGLLVAPYADRHTRTRIAQASNLDFISTGTATHSGRYTVRRSVLQSSPNAVCVIRDSGARAGDC